MTSFTNLWQFFEDRCAERRVDFDTDENWRAPSLVWRDYVELIGGVPVNATIHGLLLLMLSGADGAHFIADSTIFFFLSLGFTLASVAFPRRLYTGNNKTISQIVGLRMLLADLPSFKLDFSALPTKYVEEHDEARVRYAASLKHWRFNSYARRALEIYDALASLCLPVLLAVRISHHAEWHVAHYVPYHKQWAIAAAVKNFKPEMNAEQRCFY